MHSLSHAWQIIVRAAHYWYDNDADRSAAAVSYFALFAFAPLLLYTIALVSVFFDHGFVVSVIISWGSLLGEELTGLLAHAVSEIGKTEVPVIGPLFFIGITVLGINEFTNGLHQLWEIPHQGPRGFFKKSFFSSLFILFLSALIFVTFILQTPLTTQITHTADADMFAAFLFSVRYTITSIILLTTLFTTAFMLLPFRAYSLFSSLVGGATAALLFSGGKILIASYTHITPIPELYGAAGTLIIFVIWVFFSACVVYYGAAITRAHAELRR